MDSFKIRLISINLTSYYYFYINLEFFPSKKKKKKKKKIYLIFFAIILKLKQRTTKSRKSRNGKRRVAMKKKKKKCRFDEFVFFFFFFGCFKSYIDSKPIYRPKSIEIAETTRYTPVSRAVQIRSVFVPVQVPTWKILAVLDGMERNCLPWCVG